MRAHVWVWKCIKGNTPKGWHIHHIDKDKSNNDINNLSLVTPQAHPKLHITEEKREWSRRWCEVIRPLTKEWHASEEGRKWHKNHGIKTWATRIPIKIECLVCHKVVETKSYHQKFCHPNCKAKHGRRRKKNQKPQET